MKKKRSVIPAKRLEQLRKKNVVYEVRCAVTDCPCGNPQAGCGRGFFSLFMQAIYGIDFAKRLQIPYYINFGNCPYAYTDIERLGDGNFWNNYFNQPVKSCAGSDLSVFNEIIEVYPLRIWNKLFLRNMSDDVVKHLEFSNEVKAAFQVVSDNFKSHYVLGVHIRRTDHPEEISPVKIESYLKAIDKRLVRADRIFLSTDDAEVVDVFVKKYGDILLTNNTIRTTGEVAVHAQAEIKEKYKLGLDALVDCYSLSQCQEAILTHSNLSYSALLLNPELKYKLMERFATKIDRLKTMMLYNLNRWNIRKW